MLSNRRVFFKNISLAGLVFSGMPGFSFAQAGESKTKEKVKHWDVIVVGGGPGGVPAAVAASRNGARVLLVEKYGFLGGMATSALVLPYMKYSAGDTLIIRGLFEEFLDVLQKNGGIREIHDTAQDQIRLNTFTTDLQSRAHFDDELMKCVLDRFVLDSGVQLLLHGQAIGVLKKENTVKTLRVFHKGGVEDLSADIFIDSTGDGDIATWAGAEIEIGRKEDGACQPMTSSFRMARVDVSKMPDGREINRLYDNAKKRGEIKNPRENILKFHTVQPDVIHFNSTRIIGKSSLDGWSMTEAEIEGRRQVEELANFLIKYVRGFKNSYLMKTGCQIGVRESRRVMGEYILSGEDVLGARHFDDGVACGSYDIDIHNPSGTGTVIKRLKEGTYYHIPYRCLVPKGIDNLIVASRCISSTHEAHSSLRVMPIVWAIGQAGGTAAALCVKGEILPSTVQAAELRKILIEQKAFL
ncbi:MAG: FAD-dependent oxidoreductase [Candidatus Latescibacterota bacterium]